MIPVPLIDPRFKPVEAIDPAVFIRMAFEGKELAPLIQERAGALGAGPGDASRLLELGVLFQLVGERDRALTCQRAALDLCRVYRHPTQNPPRLRVLALTTLGDLMANTPFELMVEGRDVEITKVYLDAARPWPLAIPDHDLAIMAISESEAVRPLLEQLKGIETRWPRPMINAASGVLDLARERLHARLDGATGLVIPPTALVTRRQALDAVQAADLGRLFDGAALPLIVRPSGSHAGKGLERIDDLGALAAYLETSDASRFYISPFVDYAGADGLYRKYRIGWFGGRAFLCHMAISSHWMVHYLNAGMAESPDKRAEEAAVMDRFDEDFAVRHAAAFEALHKRLGLDYFAVDCAEIADGSLLIFEADIAMIIHDLDPEALYPYKKRQMHKVFDAFEDFLHGVAGGAAPHGTAINRSSAA
jgi:hypothetical protein